MRQTRLVLAAAMVAMMAVPAMAGDLEVGGKPLPMGPDASYINCDDFDFVKMRGKVVVLQLAHTKLDPCKEQVAKLKELNKKYGEKGLRIVVAFEESKEDVQAFVDGNSIDYPVVAGVSDLRQRWGISKFPTSYVLDVQGKVAWKGYFADRADIDIAALLKKVSDRPFLPADYVEITAALDAENWPDARKGLVDALAREGVIEDDRGRLQAVLEWVDGLARKAYDEANKLRAKGNYLEVYEGWLAMAKTWAGSPPAEKAQANAEALMADKKTKREIEGWRFFGEQFEKAKEIEMKDRKKAISFLKKVVSRYRGSQAGEKAKYWIDRLSE